jgi:phage-related protein (TIGR01555 family)
MLDNIMKKTKGNPNWKKGGDSPNPKGRPSKRSDGWQNAITGIGYAGYDKRVASVPIVDTITYQTAIDYWRGSDLAARYIETIPNEMLRQGFCLTVDGDSEIEDQVEAKWDELDLKGALKQALCFERAFGGGAILPGVNDGSSKLDQPLQIDKIISFDWITLIEPAELIPIYYYTDPAAPKFGEVSVYRYTPINIGSSKENVYKAMSVDIHESRLIVFPGIRVSKYQISAISQGWGDSVLTRFAKVLRDFDATWDSASILVQDFAQAVFKMKHLAEAFAMDKDGLIKSRMQALQLGRSTARAIVIDSEEDFTREQTPMAGLPEVMDRFATRLAAAADMPLTLLMGQSPSGLNATGDSDIRFFYDRVKAMQDSKLKPALERLTEMTLRSMQLNIPDWSIEFKPLWQPTEKEIIETHKLQAEIDQIYIANGVLGPDEVATSRFGSDKYSFETEVDFNDRASLTATPPDPDVLDPNATITNDGVRMDFIEKRNGKWVVTSHSGEVLGTHESHSSALLQLRAIEYAKAHKQ